VPLRSHSERNRRKKEKGETRAFLLPFLPFLLLIFWYRCSVTVNVADLGTEAELIRIHRAAAIAFRKKHEKRERRNKNFLLPFLPFLLRGFGKDAAGL
jgi:hypothetical protein